LLHVILEAYTEWFSTGRMQAGSVQAAVAHRPAFQSSTGSPTCSGKVTHGRCIGSGIENNRGAGE